MRELKIEGSFPVVPPLSVEVGLKKARTARLAKNLASPDSEPELVSPASAKTTPIVDDSLSLPTDAVTETPKRRSRQAAQKTKPAAGKAKKSPPTALAKPNWDVSKQLILDRFRQLEQECNQIKTQAAELNQQSTAIQAEMEHLRTIAKQVAPLPLAPDPTTSAYRVKPTGLRDIVDQGKLQAGDAGLDPIAEPIARRSSGRAVPPVSSQLPPTMPPVSDKLYAIAYSTYGAPPAASVAERGSAPLAGSHSVPGAGRRSPFRRQAERWWQTMPTVRWAIAVDALATVFGAVLGRLGLQLLVNAWPAIAGIISLMILLPIAAAIYLALFKPKANSVVIYRLVLITLGLVLGGKL
jgi:hypothetical protein